MKYSIDKGVQPSNTAPKKLLAGLPIVFAALLFGPLKMSPHTTQSPPHHVAQTAVSSLKQPVNLASSGGLNTGAQAGNFSSSAGTAYTSSNSTSGSGSSSDSSTSSSSTTDSSSAAQSGGRGGGTSSGEDQSSLPVSIPTTTLTTPPVGVDVDGKPIVSASGITLSLN